MASLGLLPVEGSDWLEKLNANLDLVDAASLTTPPASNVQALAESSSTVALVPSNLAALGGTTSFAGLLALATNAIGLAGTDTAKALTAAILAYVLTQVKIESFMGHNLTGACTLTGVKIGDLVLGVTGIGSTLVGDLSGSFETTITVADQIQQSSNTDLHLNQYMVVILHKS